MTTTVYLLASVGFAAIMIGIFNLVFKWSQEGIERKHATERHRAAVLESLKRIEAAIAKSNNAAR